ncbi:MAG: hypothetical protein DME51_13680 [Verrucomicrobia bacterium]|nr:MAG: hypothetical protein DME51_13680 [Verrucomicrobiota bacterium]
MSAEVVGKTWTCPVHAGVIREVDTLFCASDHLVAVVRVHADFANRVVLWELPRRLRVNHAEYIRAQYRPGATCISRFKDALAAHGEGTEIEIARARIDGVMIAGIDGHTVNGCGGNQRIIRHDGPCSARAAAVRRLPHTAADRAGISHDAAIDGGSWIDRNRVNSPFGRRVIIAARTTGHSLGLWTERGKIGRCKTQWIGRVELETEPRRNAARYARMLCGRGAQPRRIKAAGRKCQTILPVLFQLCQTSSFAL